MRLKRRDFSKNILVFPLILSNSSVLVNYNIKSREYNATDLLRDLSNESRAAQIATGDLIVTAADSGEIDNVQIDSAGTINANITLDEVGIERNVYIYEGDHDSFVGYEYQPDDYDLGDRFVDLEKEGRLVKVLNEFNELYLPELFDQPASELLPDQAETATDTQTETATDTRTEVETEDQNPADTEDMTDEISEGILSPLAQDILTITGGTGITLVVIYKYIFGNTSDD